MPSRTESLKFCAAIVNRVECGELTPTEAYDQIAIGAAEGKTDKATAAVISRRVSEVRHETPRKQSKPHKPPKRRFGRMRLPRPHASRNSILRKLGFENYRAYLKSDLWKRIRAIVLRENPNCVKCGNTATEVHHSDYTKKNLQGHSMEHLHPVCRSCHEYAKIHNGKKTKLSVANKRLGITEARSPRRKARKNKRKAWARRRRKKATSLS